MPSFILAYTPCYYHCHYPTGIDDLHHNRSRANTIAKTPPRSVLQSTDLQTQLQLQIQQQQQEQQEQQPQQQTGATMSSVTRNQGIVGGFLNTGEAAVQIETNMTRVTSWNNLSNINGGMSGSYLGGGGGGMSSFPSTQMIGVNTGFQGQLTSALVNATVMSFQGKHLHQLTLI